MIALFFDSHLNFLIDRRNIFHAVPLYKVAVSTSPYLPVSEEVREGKETTSDSMRLIYNFELKCVFNQRSEEVAVYVLVSITK